MQTVCQAEDAGVEIIKGESESTFKRSKESNCNRSYYTAEKQFLRMELHRVKTGEYPGEQNLPEEERR